MDGFIDENGDPINPRKGGVRGPGDGGYNPPGGGTIGPGGGFGGSFGGGGFGGGGYFGSGVFDSGSDFGGVLRKRRRWVQGPNGPIAVSSSPMGTDTVPAMLTPGEFVVNREATQMPGVAGALDGLNAAGLAKRYSEGGMVEGGENEMGVPGIRPEDLVQWLRLIAATMHNRSPFQDEWAGTPVDGGLMFPGVMPVDAGIEVTPGGPARVGAGYSHALYGDERPTMMRNAPVQGFAWGGMVRPQRAPGMALRTPQMPQNRVSGGGATLGMGAKQQAAPAGANPLGQMNTAWQRAQQSLGVGGLTGQSQWTPPGSNPSGDPTISLNPWSGSGWDQSRTLNQLYGLLSQFGGAGAFGPEGNQQLLASLQGEATQNADALRRRAATQADISGLDPGQRASYAMQTDLNTQGDVAKTLNAAKLGLLQNQQGFGQDLLRQLAQFNMQDWMAERQGDISKRYAPDQPSGWETLAGLGGAALGGWASGGFRNPWGNRNG